MESGDGRDAGVVGFGAPGSSCQRGDRRPALSDGLKEPVRPGGDQTAVSHSWPLAAKAWVDWAMKAAGAVAVRVEACGAANRGVGASQSRSRDSCEPCSCTAAEQVEVAVSSQALPPPPWRRAMPMAPGPV